MKADLLATIWAKGFVYVGNDSSDHAAWKCAAAAVLANPSTSVRRSAARLYSVAGEFTERLKGMGDRQGAATLSVGQESFDDRSAGSIRRVCRSGAWLRTAAVFAAFCAVASAIYVVNDLADLTADRKHPRKSRRPFASGALSIIEGAALVPLLALLGIWLGAFSGAGMPLLAYG